MVRKPDLHGILHCPAQHMLLCVATCSFVFCRQRQDERLRRGGEQKSVIVLSEQPYSSALIPLAQYAGPLYFNNGQSALEEVSYKSSTEDQTSGSDFWAIIIWQHCH